MSWVKAYAYTDGEFVLEQLLSRVEFDIAEANDLPASARTNLTFGLRRKEKGADVDIIFTDDDKTEVVRLRVLEGSVKAFLLLPRGKTRQHTLTARWNPDSGEEQWFLDGADSPLSVADASRALLEPTLFS